MSNKKPNKIPVVGGLVVNDKDPTYSWIIICMCESAQAINLYHHPISLVESDLAIAQVCSPRSRPT